MLNSTEVLRERVGVGVRIVAYYPRGTGREGPAGGGGRQLTGTASELCDADAALHPPCGLRRRSGRE